MSLRAELAVLGHAMMNRDHCERLIADYTIEHFSHREAIHAFGVIASVVDGGRQPKYGTLISENNFLIGVLGTAMDEAKQSRDPDQDFAELVETYRRKRYRVLAEQLMQLTDGDYDSEQAEGLIDSLIPHAATEMHKDYMVTSEEGARMSREALDEAMKNPGQIKGVKLSYDATGGAPVGFKSLDYTLNGLRPGDLHIFAAQSGHGKTALAMNLTRIMSYHNNRRVYYLNTEMDIVQMVNRWAAMATRIEYQRFEIGDISPSERERYDEWNTKFAKSPLTVSRIPSLSPKLTKALIKQAQRKFGTVDAVIVDYIGRMAGDNTKGKQEWQIMSDCAKELKEMAMELGVPIIALAQLNEEGKLEGAKKMRNECDGLFFFRPKTEEGEDDHGKKISVPSDYEYYLIKEKVRRGPTEGAIHCEFHKKYQFIREV